MLSSLLEYSLADLTACLLKISYFVPCQAMISGYKWLARGSPAALHRQQLQRWTSCITSTKREETYPKNIFSSQHTQIEWSVWPREFQQSWRMKGTHETRKACPHVMSYFTSILQCVSISIYMWHEHPGNCHCHSRASTKQITPARVGDGIFSPFKVNPADGNILPWPAFHQKTYWKTCMSTCCRSEIISQMTQSHDSSNQVNIKNNIGRQIRQEVLSDLQGCSKSYMRSQYGLFKTFMYSCAALQLGSQTKKYVLLRMSCFAQPEQLVSSPAVGPTPSIRFFKVSSTVYGNCQYGLQKTTLSIPADLCFLEKVTKTFKCNNKWNSDAFKIRTKDSLRSR